MTVPFTQRLSPALLAFCGLDTVLAALKPRSLSGRRAVKSVPFFLPGDEAALAAHHDRLRLARTWLDEDPGRVERLWRSLRALPALNAAFGAEWTQAEMALCAAFHYEHGRIAAELAATPLAAWLAPVESAALDDGVFGSEPSPAFHLDDARSPQLAAVRRAVRESSQALERAENEQRERLQSRHGLPKTQDAWLLPRQETAPLTALDADPELRRAEESPALVRYERRPDDAQLARRAALEAALQEERRIEHGLYAELAARLAEREAVWRREEDKLARLDLLLAAAELWRASGGVLPRIQPRTVPAAPFAVVGGRLLPLAARLAAEGASYTPLDLRLSLPAAVLDGSNMGGKTVVLQTVGFLQGLAQLGLAVPAESLDTALYAGLALIAAPEQRLGGLSSFGSEVAQMAATLPLRSEGWLYLLDEPGRTTRVEEGRALTRAVLEAVAESPSRLLLSTHLDGLDGAEVERFSMRGLRRAALDDPQTALAPLESLMDYRVTAADKARRAPGEALDVAERLGLESDLLQRARAYLSHPNGGPAARATPRRT